MLGFMRRLFGTKNQREVKRLMRRVAKINALEEDMQALSDEALSAKTDEFRARLADGATLDDLLEEAFAVVREASRRVTGMRHFDVQMIGGMVLHSGKIAEMRTGEGKTLVATLAAYLNALPGEGVHIVTVNDYLAGRDAEWMGPIYRALGLTVGVVQSRQDPESKRAAYQADVTYGTNNEFGFDYLRDNMAFSLRERFQRRLAYAIVDEVDSILIDEARTPLIISGASEESTELYQRIDKLIPKLKRQTLVDPDNPDAGGEPGDFTVDEKHRQVELTEAGHEKVEQELVRMGLLEAGDSLYSATNLNLLHHVHAGLKAHALFKRDVQYIVADGEVVIVDEHTGRTMPGRRWSEGIHQAVEAKERVAIQNESQTLASTTFQNYFRLYDKLAGMTGTADTEAFEFRSIYGLDVVVIPTHKPMIRDDANDLVFMTVEEKYDAIVDDVQDCMQRGQPVLIGTASVESSEHLSAEMKRRNIEHNVLNAKFHEREAEIVAQAGRPGAITIATNMAGRGTDIVLGGNWEAELPEDADEATRAQARAEWEQRHAQVIAAGGLHIIGTERHESRRIDNQLRGRSGRQGDPGSSRFYLSMEDNLMRIFASEGVRKFMKRLGMEKGEAIEARMVTNAIERAQRKVEQHNFDVRKNLLEFDDVSNDQRQVIYAQRRDLMGEDDISETIGLMRQEVVDEVISDFIPPQSLEEQWDIDGLQDALRTDFASEQPIRRWLEEDDTLNEETLRERIIAQVEKEAADKEANWRERGFDMRVVEKQLMLQVLDQRWKEHLATMDHLRSAVYLRAYAQKQPKQEYKREAFELFQQLLNDIRHDTIRLLSRIQIQSDDEAEEIERKRREEAERMRVVYSHQQANALQTDQPEDEGADAQPRRRGAQPTPIGRRRPNALEAGGGSADNAPFKREDRKVGRNERCPCGSGKKYKHCHGKAA